MHDDGKSHVPIVAEKSPNKGADNTCGGDGAKGDGQGKSVKQNTHLTQRGEVVRNALTRIREVAKRDKTAKFTALYHHVYNIDTLRVAFTRMKRKASPGVDGETWEGYSKHLEENLQKLSERLARKAYHARPTRRVRIPKPDGGERLLGVPALEDKIVQAAAAMVLNAIYEVDFVGFSYGFRVQRGPHKALDALYVAIQTKKVNWILDADLKSFFDTIDHQWMQKFLEHRIADPYLIRLILKWLKAGVMEDGEWQDTDLGTPQGGVISPLLANIYLHYVFDLWTHQWRQRWAKGDLVAVRYADDFIVGFQYPNEARQYLADLRIRLHEFGLTLHPKKTRLIEFGRFAERERARRKEGKPETFDFLGFTHISGQTRNGRFIVVRHTIRKRRERKLAELGTVLRKRMHDPIDRVGRWLGFVLSGYFNYHAVPTNGRILAAFRRELERKWLQTLRRRSQKHRGVTWDWFKGVASRYLPPVRILHPYPLERFYG
jgi:RNA-directed DNA polymerase